MVTFVSQPEVNNVFYQITQLAGKWAITRKDGQVLCHCCNHEEATRLMQSLNADQQKFPKEHK